MPKPVVIYGWHYPSGSPIQPLYNGHGETYADYSHGIRLVQNALMLDGRPDSVTNLLANPALAPLLLDGTLVAQRANTSGFTAGTIMLGLMDAFPSIANPAQDSFVLFDNLRVEDLSDRVRFLSASVSSNRQVQLLLSAVPGQTYVLESSTNLSNWVPLAVQTAGNDPLRFTDTNAGSFPARFYQARSAGSSL